MHSRGIAIGFGIGMTHYWSDKILYNTFKQHIDEIKSDQHSISDDNTSIETFEKKYNEIQRITDWSDITIAAVIISFTPPTTWFSILGGYVLSLIYPGHTRKFASNVLETMKQMESPTNDERLNSNIEGTSSNNS